MSDVIFVSSNNNKTKEVLDILHATGIDATSQHIHLQEIQSDSLCDIAISKAVSAHEAIGGPVLVEDDGLFIRSLGGFPGPYSSYVYDTIGIQGILQLVDKDRDAMFCAVVAYRDDTTTVSFMGELAGTISDKPRGRGWGYDPIFCPYTLHHTFAEVDKTQHSHRRVALGRFADWFKAYG